jgi:hypothetical protein
MAKLRERELVVMDVLREKGWNTRAMAREAGAGPRRGAGRARRARRAGGRPDALTDVCGDRGVAEGLPKWKTQGRRKQERLIRQMVGQT